MTKTPEQMAEEYVAHNRSYPYDPLNAQDRYMRNSYLVGYQAAKDQVADVGKVMCNTTMEEIKAVDTGELMPITNLLPPAKWISVKERLPEDGQTCIYVIYIPKKNEWKLDYGEWQAEENVFYGEYIDYRDLNWTLTHWMPLPKPPEENK